MVNDKRTEFMLNKGLWWKLKTIAMTKSQTLSALFREILVEYVGEYDKRTKETNINEGRKNANLGS